MNARDSIFGAEPERLRQLIRSGMDVEDVDAEDPPPASGSVGGVMERPGTQIGCYKLLHILGEGGMGVVYLAEQEHLIRRRVALKIIKPGMDSRRVLARFDAERQALALLDHPNIAHVYDAGMTAVGRPYFVMEYVKGSPITEYCDHHKLSIEDRLALFVQVCDAVQHAHQKGIIHRDIKPSNILVSVENDRPTPKIIDFGVAKAIGRPLTDRTLFTEDSHLLGTPEYMSPEQADMASEDIDTRSDVYSLGVLLYVLLTGVLPFDPQTLRGSGIENIRKTIRETDPKTPSTRLTALGEEAAKIAEMRGTQISTLASRLKKELEWIPLKAMRKERSQRYRSASELADDIENYLKGAPLIAGPPGTVYRLKKFVRRNHVLVGGIVAVLLVLVAGVIASTLFAVRAERARSQAQEVSDYLLTYVLDSRNDGKLLDRDFEKMLDNAVKGLEGKFEDQPLVEAEIRYTLAQKYLEALNPEPAKVLLERAYQIRLQQFGPEDVRGLHFAMILGWVFSHLGQHDVAIRMWTDQIETFRKAYGNGHWRIMLLLTSISRAYEFLGNYERAEACLDEALKRWELLRDQPAFRGRLFAIQTGRGGIYLAQGRYALAEQTLRQALELELPSGVGRLSCMTALSAVYREQGRYEEAQQLCETALDMMRADLGEDHWAVLAAQRELGRILMERGLLPEAEKLISEALRSKRFKRSLARQIPPFINALGIVRTKQGDYADANDLFTEALNVGRQILGENHPETLETLNDFGVLRREQGQYEEAGRLLNEALEGKKTTLGPDHPGTLDTMHELGVLYKEQAQYEKAESLLVQTLEGRRLKLGDTHPHTLESWHNLIELYEAWGKPEQAARWRTILPQPAPTVTE